MKRLIFVMLMMVCSVSWAEWELSGRADTFTHYIDISSIRRDGVMAKMWIMNDYFVMQTAVAGKKYKSDKSLMVFNCAEETVELLSGVAYSGSMGEGNVVLSGTTKEIDLAWQPIVPGTVLEVMWRVACGKK